MKVLALIGVLALAGGGAATPKLRAVDLDPLTLTGSGFRTNERVRLLVAAPPVVKSRLVRAGARGRFRVTFAIKVDRCDSVVVQAIGLRGSRATYQHDVVGCVQP